MRAALLTMCLLPGIMKGEMSVNDTLPRKNEPIVWQPDIAPTSPKKPWLALGEVVASDALFHLLTRYVVGEDYAQISWSSIKNNFKQGFMWDNDKFETNLFSHPYQGNLYYNCARSNGLNFWESSPYALLGSAIWELFLETQPPSINDILSTPLGGIAFGEITHRLSSLVLNGRATGKERVWRELAAAAINPVRGVNRLITGEAWRVGHRYVDREATLPFHLNVDVGYRMLDQLNSHNPANHMGLLDVCMIYNDPFEIEGNIPFEHFTFRMMFNLFSRQPVIGEINLCAPIWGREHDLSGNNQAFFGIFQNYNYYNSEELRTLESSKASFRIAETVSYGPGAMVRLRMTPESALTLSGYASGIVLGGAMCEYYYFHDRDYNMGSGYSLHFNGRYSLRQRLAFSLGCETYHVFTWKGYEHKPYQTLNPHYIDAQGAVGNSRMHLLNLRGSWAINSSMGISAEAGWRHCLTSYKYFPKTKIDTFEFKLMLSYWI